MPGWPSKRGGGFKPPLPQGKKAKCHTPPGSMRRKTVHETPIPTHLYTPLQEVSYSQLGGYKGASYLPMRSTERKQKRRPTSWAGKMTLQRRGNSTRVREGQVLKRQTPGGKKREIMETQLSDRLARTPYPHRRLTLCTQTCSDGVEPPSRRARDAPERPEGRLRVPESSEREGHHQAPGRRSLAFGVERERGVSPLIPWLHFSHHFGISTLTINILARIDVMTCSRNSESFGGNLNLLCLKPK